MPELSIVIVNYNVKHFLEQCLISVYKAIENIDTEVFVVDNNSVDGSCSMVKKRFPKVILIENKINHGFSYANNQAIRKAKGKYVLLLNPDTVVEENTFSKCIEFMDNNPETGGLSVKMIDGKGRFLPESKRGLPSPKASFFKIFGLTSLFPKSKTFAHYYLGHLSEDEINEIEILPGAFMFLRKTVLEKTGLLDEDYFMYGEDIDLSYKITKAGYKNYYLPETKIIHYKGESTKKGSLNYVFVFYNAMIIFAKKHFSHKNARVFSFLINIAIYFRAFLSILSRFIKKIFLPALDAILIFLSYSFIKPVWENYKFESGGHYPDEFLTIAVPCYIIIWLTSIWLNNGYSKNIKLLSLLKGTLLGTIAILFFYALLPEGFRFSRALILIGTISTLIIVFTNRLLVHFTNFIPHKFKLTKKHRLVIIGFKDEAERVKDILNEAQLQPIITGCISPSENKQEEYHIANISQLKEIIKIHKTDELVFCAQDISSDKIMNTMFLLSETNIDFKIAQPGTLSIIGSNSIETSGELYTVEINTIAKENNVRNKRLFDIFSSILIILLSPVIIAFSKLSFKIINNSFNVLLGFKTWVGYSKESDVSTTQLPKIKGGILTPLNLDKKKEHSDSFKIHSNMVYAKNYSILNDLKILLKGFNKIGK